MTTGTAGPHGKRTIFPKRARTEQICVTEVEGFDGPVDGIGSPGLASTVAAIARASMQIAALVRVGALLDRRDVGGSENVHGEVQIALDVLATERLGAELADAGSVSGMACEELEEPQFYEVTSPADDRYLVVLDPIDGSSNANVDITIGTIFGIYPAGGAATTTEAFLRPASEMAAAGYVLYGPSVLLVLATPGQVAGFTLDPEGGSYQLTTERLTMPQQPEYYSANEGYVGRWTPAVLSALEVAKRGRSSRYVGSLVSDFHRNLVRGGVFLYPADERNPSGKLRALYEAGPLAFICAQAQAVVSSGSERLLQRAPQSLHERTPLFIGPEPIIAEIEAALAGD
jgi:fructose-1,6-bisphosphatase I